MGSTVFFKERVMEFIAFDSHKAYTQYCVRVDAQTDSLCA